MEMVKSNEWFTRTVECERERDRGACRQESRKWSLTSQ